MEEKRIVVIETPPTSPKYTRVTCLMSQSELDEARQERPDLLFSFPEETPSEGELVVEAPGITIKGMTAPSDVNVDPYYQEFARQLQNDEVL